MRFGAALWLALGLLLAAQDGAAHTRSISYSSWVVDEDGADVTLRLKLLELSRLGPEALPPGSLPGERAPGAPDLSARLFPHELSLLADGQPCTPPPVARRRPDEPGWVRYHWRVECPAEATSLVIRSRILLEVAPSHMHFARVRLANASAPIREQVLTEAAPDFVVRRPDSDVPPGDDVGSRLVDYVSLGVEHILTGWDHLAFVFGLLLLARRVGEIARLVTGFTLAHSLTLALAVLDWVHPRAAAVEAMIAFSVALVAIEKGWLLSGRRAAVPLGVLGGLLALGLAVLMGWASLPMLTVVGLAVFSGCYFALAERNESEWLRVCLTFAFGLVHGFGFAGILVEMTLPTERLVPALLGFNVGVELGQIAVVLLLWPLLGLARRFSSEGVTRWATELAAASLCGLGLFWLVERTF
jgi:hypothetical protein